MQCSCGNEMKDHKIQRDNKIVAEFKSCDSKDEDKRGCGRVHWMWAGPEIDRKTFPLAPEFITETVYE
jgi:hypothetical protein